MATKKIAETAKKAAKTAEKAITKAKESEAVKKAAKTASKAISKAKESETVKKATSTAKKAASTAKKAASSAKKATEKVTAYVEFGGKQISTAEIADKVRAAYKAEGNKAVIKSIEIYVKPEENAAYYVVNGKAEGKKIDL